MLPWFTQGVTDALNWATSSTKSSSSQATLTESTGKEAESQEPEKITTETQLPPLVHADDLAGELLLLKSEAMNHATKRTKTASNKAEGVHANNQKFTKTLGEINKHSKGDGSFKVNDSLQALLAEMKAMGIASSDPNKKEYTKEEARKLTEEMKQASSNLDTDLRLAINEMQECVHQRNLYYQEIKSLFDKFFESIRKVCSAIVSR